MRFMPKIMLSAVLGGSLIWLSLTGSAQPAPPQAIPDLNVRETMTRDAMQRMLQTRAALRQQLQAQTQSFRKAATEEQKTLLSEEINALEQQIERLDWDFESIATGVDLEVLAARPAKTFDWQQEIQEVLGPLIEELKNMTARPREIDKLRREIANYEKRLELVNTALKNISHRAALAEAPQIQTELRRLQTEWEARAQEFSNQITIATYQLEEKLRSNQSIVKSARAFLRAFFRTRGLHLLLALLALLLVLLLLRGLHGVLYRYTRLKHLMKRPFWLRIADILYHLLTFIGTTATVLTVLYISGDWVLLGLAFLLLFGMAWTARQTFPIFLEQIKLFLNVSTVREGERVLYNGLPWQIKDLNLYTKLHNPALKGGLVRLPLRELVGLHSRPFHKDEPWFPCQEGDVVKLRDGAMGNVMLQTPEQVIIKTLDGVSQTYPTLAFLQQHPINYSHQEFTIFITFGLDYRHQTAMTTTIPHTLRAFIAEAFRQETEAPDLLTVNVEFQDAAASALNLLIAATFTGRAASRYFPLTRTLQRLIVEACNTHGWSIPFPQITLHAGADFGVTQKSP